MTVTGRSLDNIPGMLGPRKADGSLSDVHFLKLAPGSKMIDKGEDVGIPFTAVAPDLGAFESGIITNVEFSINHSSGTPLKTAHKVYPQISIGNRSRYTGNSMYSISGKKSSVVPAVMPSSGIYIIK